MEQYGTLKLITKQNDKIHISFYWREVLHQLQDIIASELFSN